MKNIFYNYATLTSLDILNFDTTKVTDMTSMFEKCTELVKLDISNFYPINNEIYSGMFFGYTNLEYFYFYNYYENENTTYNDIITNAHSQIILCIHVKNESRKIQSHLDHLDIECLRPYKDPTTIVLITSIPTEKTTIADTTNNPTEKIKKAESTEISVEIQQTTQADNKFISSTSNKISDNDENKSSSLANIIDSESINSYNIVQTNIITSEYTIIDDILYLFNRYNNTQIYDYIVEFMLQDFNGINKHKI